VVYYFSCIQRLRKEVPLMVGMTTSGLPSLCLFCSTLAPSGLRQPVKSACPYCSLRTVVAAYRHMYEENLETSRGNRKEVAGEGTVTTRGRCCGDRTAGLLPWPRYSDMRDFTTELRSPIIGSVYSRNKRGKLPQL